MPDALRTRIAAALKSYGLVDQYGDPLPDEELFDLADAVIRELKLRQEYSVEYTPDGCSPPIKQLYEWSCGHERVTEHRDQAEFDAKSFYEEEPEEQPNVVSRYVTEWETDGTA